MLLLLFITCQVDAFYQEQSRRVCKFGGALKTVKINKDLNSNYIVPACAKECAKNADCVSADIGLHARECRLFKANCVVINSGSAWYYIDEINGKQSQLLQFFYKLIKLISSNCLVNASLHKSTINLGPSVHSNQSAT